MFDKAISVIEKEGFIAFIKKSYGYFNRNRKYARWIIKNSPSMEDIKRIRIEITGFRYQPTVSVILPVYNPEPEWLECAINSVFAQLYPKWELCIADDGSTREDVKSILNRYKKNPLIHIKDLKRNQGISQASNEALSMAKGEYVAFLDHDDELAIEALYEYVKLLNRYPEADLIYSDEDKIEVNGKRVDPFFKPNYSPELLLSMNYVCHFSMFRRSLIEDIHGFRSAYDGSQDYDLLLRFVEKTDHRKIFHVPKILYHWRKVEGSAAKHVQSKSYAIDAAKLALLDCLKRNDIAGDVTDGRFSGSYRVRRKIKKIHCVSIIIPFKDNSSLLRTCLESIFQKSTYKNYKIYLVNIQSQREETFAYLNALRMHPAIHILNYDKTFNCSAICNFAISKVDSDYFILLNNDIEVISSDWIESMLEFVQRADIGAAGALLCYPNNTIQHCGIIVGIGGGAANVYQHFRKDFLGYFGRIHLIQNLSAVTGACLMCDKATFDEVGGFDENLSHAFNDVDFCLRIKEKGYRVVYTPYAELNHHESLSGFEQKFYKRIKRPKKEWHYFQAKWKGFLEKGDPYYNPNLSLEKADFSIRI